MNAQRLDDALQEPNGDDGLGGKILDQFDLLISEWAVTLLQRFAKA
jgi:hypothetical protein